LVRASGFLLPDARFKRFCPVVPEWALNGWDNRLNDGASAGDVR
jgi:hypothetical protein